MSPPALRLLSDELLIDNFAGGGGASTGLEWAAGRSPDFAINHDAKAVAMHQANHPQTKHFCEDVFTVNPREVVGSRRIGLAWFSPDCTYYSKARGGKPFRDPEKARKRRGLAGVVIRWASLPPEKRPRVILLENVEEFEDWGPLGADGKPDPLRAGHSFRRWLGRLKGCGYEVQFRVLVASDYGAPTSRARLFLIARCDGRPIVWPKPTHGPGLLTPRSAAECIDFSLPVHSIFLTKKEARPFRVKRPLAEATMARIARGLWRYVLNTDHPFVVPQQFAPYLVRTAHGERDKNGKKRGRGEHSIREPLPTQAASNDFALVAPALIQSGWGEREGQAPRALNIHDPLGTVMADGVKHALVAAFLARHYGGHENDGAPMQLSLPTVTARDHHALVLSHMMKLRGGLGDHQNTSQDWRDPAPTITTAGGKGGHLAEVRAFLVKYYGTDQDPQLGLPLATVTTKDRFGLVTVHGVDYAIADICMRMLSPRELFNATSFLPSYLIDVLCQGKPLTKGDQVQLVGNAVPPVMGEVLARANLSDNPEGMRSAA